MKRVLQQQQPEPASPASVGRCDFNAFMGLEGLNVAGLGDGFASAVAVRSLEFSMSQVSLGIFGVAWNYSICGIGGIEFNVTLKHPVLLVICWPEAFR